MSRRVVHFGALAFAMLACGAKVGGGNGGERGPDGGVAADSTPPPTCAQICDRLVDLCTPGASSAKCADECDLQVRTLAGCEPELDRFLACMGRTEVECSPGEIVILGCSDERLGLERCGGR